MALGGGSGHLELSGFSPVLLQHWRQRAQTALEQGKECDQWHLLIVVPTASTGGWPMLPGGSTGLVLGGFSVTVSCRLLTVAARVGRSAGQFWKSCTTTPGPVRCSWCPGGKGKRIGIATSSASQHWKCRLAGFIIDLSRSSSRPKKRPS